ncbi:hypothetical protein Ga0466249_005307 [Sporomusaceae bacterium BoRhaA]|uniref:hypothetical protein n=1 Tax=Pelorhabdus rhamnosifermentans TaxID=2772457 RepID=UPI001C061B8B|nr:hypothetical protein [Pelorhabdus rhamnosifermentans]MBU2704153.1 hypothetical protein [Pelorhabdus rhamnosifermentans]
MLNKLSTFWYTKMEGPYAHYLAHFLGGFTLSTIVGHFYSLLAGLICGIIAAILKEIVDKLSGKGSPEVKAAVITSLGALLSYIILGGVL